MRERHSVLDQLIRDAIHDESLAPSPPPAADAWREVQAELQRAALRASAVRVRAIAGVSAVLVLAAGAFLVRPATSQGWLDRMQRVVAPDRVEIQVSRNLAPTRGGPARPPEVREVEPDAATRADMVEREVSLDDARRELPFPLPTPARVPAGVRLRRVTVRELRTAPQVLLDYRDGGDRFLQIRLEQLPQGPFGSGRVYPIEGARVSTVQVGKVEAQMIEHPSHNLTLMTWLDGRIRYEIQSRFSVDETLAAARSLVVK